MTSTTCLQSARSLDYSLVAIVPPSSSSSSTGRIVVQVYQVTSSSSQLQLTLTHKSTSPLQELLFCGNSAVVARVGTSQIILWDLDQGVVNQSLESRDEEQFLGLAATDEFFYTLTKHGTKLVVNEYHYATGGLVGTIKSGRWQGRKDGTPIVNFCVSSTHVVVQTGPGMLQVMSTYTGERLGKIKALGVTTMKLVAQETLVTTQSGGTIVLYNATTCEEMTRIPHPVTSSIALSDGLVQFMDDKLLIGNTVFRRDKKDGSFAPLRTIEAIHPMAPFLTNDGRLLVLFHQKQTGCYSRFFKLPDNRQQELTETEASETTETSQKRKSTEPTVLGPGPAGIEVAPPIKKSKGGDEAEATKDFTIAEQLTNAPQHQDVEERMRVLRNTTFDPNDDASIKMILSGVNKRLDDLTSAVRGLESSLCQQLQAQLSNMQGMVRNEIEQALRAAADAISQTFGNIDVTELLSTVDSPERELQEVRFPATSLPSQDPQQIAALNSPRLSPLYPSLLLMWDEWHGSGGTLTKNKPIPGGFGQLEQMYKAKWRRHLNGAQVRHFTRIRLIIDGIKRMAEVLAMTGESARDQLEMEWTRLKKSPDAMVRYLQELGYLKTAKPRGKTRRIQNV